MLFVTNFLFLIIMGKLTLFDISIPRETIIEERENVYMNRTPEQRFFGTL